MDIEPAGVHGPGRFRGIREACGLGDWQGVQVGAGHDHGAASVRQDAHHPGAADVLHSKTEGFERCRNKFRRGVFLEAQLRVAVQLPVRFTEPIQFVPEARKDGLLRR